MLYYRQRKTTYIRSFGEIGYVVSSNFRKELCVNGTGAIFLSVLSRQFQSLDVLLKKLVVYFKTVNIDRLEMDACNFYDSLYSAGYLSKSETFIDSNSDSSDDNFSYKNYNFKPTKIIFPPVIIIEKSKLQKYFEEQLQEKAYLVKLQIEVTKQCNERCLHCYIPHDQKTSIMSPKIFYSLLPQLKEMNVLYVSLTGGEPLSHPHFKEFLQELKKYDFCISILSNLTLLDDAMVLLFKDIGINFVQTSLYSMNPKNHDTLTNLEGSFEKTKNAIEKLIQNDIPVKVACPITKITKKDFVDVYNWCNTNKIEFEADLSISSDYEHQGKNLDVRLDTNEIETVLNMSIKDNLHYQKILMNKQFFDKCHEYRFLPDDRLCGAGHLSCFIGIDGAVFPCAAWQNMLLGNIHKTSLHEIWEKSEKLNWIRSLKRKDLGNGKCCKCDKAAFCSVCMAKNANESDKENPLAISQFFCEIAKIHKNTVKSWSNSLTINI